MKTEGNNPRFALRLGDDGTDSRIEEYLEENGLSDATRFLPKDDDELNADACEGRFDRVVFSDLEALLSAIWKGDVKIDRWLDLRVRIDLVNSSGESDWRALLPIIAETYARWQSRQRRRQIVTSFILSAIALLGVAILFILIPPAD